MSHATALIARMKVRELQRQRDALVTRYDAMLAAAKERTGTEAVAALYEELGRLELAREKLHPALPDLRAVLRTGLDEAQRATWQARLEAEIERGRARSEAAYVFGRLLEETSAVRPAARPADAESCIGDTFARITKPGDDAVSPQGIALLDELFGVGGPLAGMPAFFEKVAGETEGDAFEALLYMAEIAADAELPADVRQEAEGLREDEAAGVALSDGLRMLGANLAGWRFDGPIALRTVASAHRERVHPRLDLVTLLLFDAVAAQLGKGLTTAFRSGHANRRARHDRLRELNAPAVIIENERRQLAEPLGALTDPSILDEATHAGSVATIRDRELGTMGSSFERGGGYEYGASRALPRLLAAELAVRRAGRPGTPIFVLKTDVADCFPSMPHALVLEVLARAGVPEDARAFIATTLRAPLAHDGATRTAARGLLLGQTLSRLLANTVLSLCELAVKRRCAGVVILRAVDDFVFIADDAASLARAFEALKEALAAFALAVNEAKTGAVALGAVAPGAVAPGAVALDAEAPTEGPWQRLPAFGPLALTREGFRVDAEALHEYLAASRAALRASPSLLHAVRDWNRDLRFLCDATLADIEIEPGHRARTKRVLLEALAEDGGVPSWLRQEIDRRFTPRHRLPDGWLHWPVTAGGVGLIDIRLELGARPESTFEPPAEPFDERTSAAWGTWYASFLATVKGDEPLEDAATRALTEDFIARSGELRGKAKSTLAPYWRWVLSTHGPDILEAFGTYRFLVKRLVPLELIRFGLADLDS